MIVKTSYINNDATRFVPRNKFENEVGTTDIWLTVNRKRKPPVVCEGVVGPEVRLGVDGMPITLKINPLTVNLVRGDVIERDGYELYIFEIL